jgi:hypothetical protein
MTISSRISGQYEEGYRDKKQKDIMTKAEGNHDYQHQDIMAINRSIS